MVQDKPFIRCVVQLSGDRGGGWGAQNVSNSEGGGEVTHGYACMPCIHLVFAH